VRAAAAAAAAVARGTRYRGATRRVLCFAGGAAESSLAES
jgi:hypothetical protein